MAALISGWWWSRQTQHDVWPSVVYGVQVPASTAVPARLGRFRFSSSEGDDRIVVGVAVPLDGDTGQAGQPKSGDRALIRALGEVYSTPARFYSVIKMD